MVLNQGQLTLSQAAPRDNLRLSGAVLTRSSGYSHSFLNDKVNLKVWARAKHSSWFQGQRMGPGTVQCTSPNVPRLTLLG